MTLKEKNYVDAVEQSIENFGAVQRDFVFDRRGVHALVTFVEELEGHPPVFSLDDPVIQKARTATEKVITGLKSEIKILKKLKPPVRWETFHSVLLSSLQQQHKGYREMFKVFKDGKAAHIIKGHEIVDQGLSLLAGGKKKTRGKK